MTVMAQFGLNHWTGTALKKFANCLRLGLPRGSSKIYLVHFFATLPWK